jgi:transcriptional regulator with XRE-family HTH domain
MTDLALRQESDEEERQRLGGRLREARKYLGLKQEEVATYLKIPRTALTDSENGQRCVEVVELTRLILSTYAHLFRQRDSKAADVINQAIAGLSTQKTS